ncbi:hypothetical protein Kisp01_26880 [Kineosporia sp. NBRC 101677]|nr:hypothetical protein Kisp01_26880 [Kineosporia sp. NBRC 101677]
MAGQEIIVGMSFSPHHLLADEIAARIQAGHHAPGTPLPSPADLEQAGHSREAVRQALRWLVEQGWVQIGTYGGYVVADDQAGEINWDEMNRQVEAHLRRLRG